MRWGIVIADTFEFMPDILAQIRLLSKMEVQGIEQDLRLLL
jgi:hypothetical protein